MRKKRTFFVLIVAVFLITLTTKVMANFESSNYTKFNGWEGLGNIISTGDKSLNQYFTKSKKLKDLPYEKIKSLENVIIFLINFKQEQKANNNIEYTKIIKIIEKNNRLSIIEQKKEEFKKRTENRMRQLIEKNLKIFLINDKRTNVRYHPFKKNKIELEDNDDKDDEKSIELVY